MIAMADMLGDLKPRFAAAAEAAGALEDALPCGFMPERLGQCSDPFAGHCAQRKDLRCPRRLVELGRLTRPEGAQDRRRDQRARGLSDWHLRRLADGELPRGLAATAVKESDRQVITLLGEPGGNKTLTATWWLREKGLYILASALESHDGMIHRLVGDHRRVVVDEMDSRLSALAWRRLAAVLAVARQRWARVLLIGHVVPERLEHHLGKEAVEAMEVVLVPRLEGRR